MTIIEPSEELESEIIELTSGLLDEYKENLTSQGYDADAIVELADSVMAAE